MPDGMIMQHPEGLQEALRERTRAEMKAAGLSQAAAAKDASIAYATFSAWLNGKYEGDNERVAQEVARWLDARAERQTAAAALPGDIGFVRTASAEAIWSVLRYAHIAPAITVVATGAGVGKTSAAKEYARLTPNVWLATMDPTTANVSPMLGEIVAELKLEERSPAKFRPAICRYVKNKGGLLIIDEAQHLKAQALDALRSIHDRTGCGLALLGNETVYARLEGGSRKPEFAQIFSRIAARLSQTKPRDDDAPALLDAWGVTAADARRFLCGIAVKSGALRGMVMTIRQAHMVAAGAGAEPRLEHYKAAWERLSNTSS